MSIEGKIKIDGNSGIPIWLQLRNRLLFLITSGSYQSGDKLPTVRELAVELGINYNTVSKVYRDIERDGYIVSQRGKGTFVAAIDDMPVGSVSTEIDCLIDEFVQQCQNLGISRTEVADLVACRVGESR